MQDKDDIQIVWNFQGYQNNSDITTVDSNVLVPPSQNVLVTGDIIKCVETRSGYKLLGRARTQTGTGIRSKYDNFTNSFGIKLPIREWQFGPSLESIYEVYYTHPVTDVSDWIRINDITGVQQPHELYFTEWYDDETTLPILLWTSGATTVGRWNGGISVVTAFTNNSITLFDDIARLGFATSGAVFISGSAFSYTGFSGNTFTGVTPDPTTNGVAINDYAIDGISALPLISINTPLTNVPSLDVCATLDNHVFYGSYQTRQLYVSNSFASQPLQELTNTVATVDDIVISGAWTGIGEENIKIEITTDVAAPVLSYNVAPDANFIGVQTGGTRHVYTIIISAMGTPDQFDYYLDGVLQSAGNNCTLAPFSLANGVSVYFTNTTGHSIGDSWTYEVGGTDQFTVYQLQDDGTFTQIQGPTPISTSFVYNGVTIDWQLAFQNTPYGHRQGDYWTIHLLPEIRVPYINTYFSAPVRKPGQGGLVKLDSPPVFLKVQEEQMHANSRSGYLTILSFEPSADLLSEQIQAQRIKTAVTNKALKQALVVNTQNDIYYVNIENQLVSLGRVENVFSQPQAQVISLPVKNDFFQLKFVVTPTGNGNARADWADNKVFICVPSAALWYIYDEFYGFWQPPQTGAFSGISVINGQICAHSAISDETYVLFSSSNDNGYPFMTVIALPFDSNGRRDRLKAVSELFTEAYKTANTNLFAKVNLEYGNCENGPEQRLDPKVCGPDSRASLGKASLAKHGLANDPIEGLLKFRNILPFNEKMVYEYQIIYYSDSIDQYYKLVSTGINAMIQDQRSVSIKKTAGTTQVPQYPGIPGTPKISPLVGGTNIPDDVADQFLGGN